LGKLFLVSIGAGVATWLVTSALKSIFSQKKVRRE